MSISRNAKNAIMIGTLCLIAYLAVYVARNTLSAVSTQLTSFGVMNDSFYGTLSAAYFLFYATGQVINGAIGQKINARWMISLGLFFACITNLLFPYIVHTKFAAILIYGLSGFFLAMIYGPMTKVVAENTDPIHAVRCSVGYTFASFFGSPIAGVFAMIFAWQTVFKITSVILGLMAIICFIIFLIFEQKGIVKYNLYKRENNKGGTVKELLKHNFVKFCLISIITGMIRTSWVSWLPKYFNEFLGYNIEQSSMTFSISTFIMAFITFIAVFIYEKFKRNINLTLIIMFSVSIVFFALVLLFNQPIINVTFMIIAIMASNGAATMLWSVYCPSLRDTGMVSGATGFLDFLSYVGAAIFSLVVGTLLKTVGWNYVLIIPLSLMILGLAISLPYKKKKLKDDDYEKMCNLR